MTIQQLEDQLEVCANAEYRMNDKNEVVLITTINDQFYLID